MEKKKQKALAEAVASIYFADSSDYGKALWDVINALSPKAAELLDKDPEKAYEKYVEGKR